MVSGEILLVLLTVGRASGREPNLDTIPQTHMTPEVPQEGWPIPGLLSPDCSSETPGSTQKHQYPAPPQTSYMGIFGYEVLCRAILKNSWVCKAG